MDENILGPRDLFLSLMDDAAEVDAGAHLSAGSGTDIPRGGYALGDPADGDTALLDAYSRAVTLPWCGSMKTRRCPRRG